MYREICMNMTARNTFNRAYQTVCKFTPRLKQILTGLQVVLFANAVNMNIT